MARRLANASRCGFPFRIQIGFSHARSDEFARGARLVPAHVEEDSIHRLESIQDFGGLFGQKILVRRAHVQDLPGGAEDFVGPVISPLHLRAIRFASDPLGVEVGRVFVALDTQINRGARIPSRCRASTCSPSRSRWAATPEMAARVFSCCNRDGHDGTWRRRSRC